MLHYKFFCHDCKEYFSKIFSPIDYEEGEVICPKCGSKRVEQHCMRFVRFSFGSIEIDGVAWDSDAVTSLIRMRVG
jgi:DNA-directed RNA polymerase subunit RPC12/RpoP